MYLNILVLHKYFNNDKLRVFYGLNSLADYSQTKKLGLHLWSSIVFCLFKIPLRLDNISEWK